MHQQRLVTGLAAAFGLMTAVLLVSGIFVSPALLIMAAIFGGVTYLLYYQASGRLLDRIYRGVERRAATEDRQGGFGAGPREEWTPPREEQRRRAGRQRRRTAGRRRARAPVQQSGPSPREAARILGVDPGADDSTVKDAYRKRIKEVHPDADDGDEEEFKRVQEAYEVLTD